VVYDRDLDLLHLHRAIRERIGCQRGRVPELRQRIRALQSKLNTSSCYEIERRSLVTSIATLEEEVIYHETGAEWERYITAALPLLEAYVPLASDESKGVVEISSRDVALAPEAAEKISQRLSIIKQYLHVARNHMSLDVVWEGAGVATCPTCGTPLVADPEEDVYGCKCGYERDALSQGSSFKDSQRTNAGGRNEYKDRETFIKNLARVTGTCVDKIPPNLYEQLDKFFAEKGFYSGAQIRAMPHLPNGKKPHTSVELLNSALSATSNAEFYRSHFSIAHQYWGWKLWDLSAIHEGLIEDYDKTQLVHNVIKERDSSLNINIRTYWHLRARGFPCQPTDFKWPITPESLKYHNRMLQIMGERTGVKHTPIM